MVKITASQVNALFQEEDIEGFIKLGAPADEYESEADVIATAINALPAEQWNKENITAIICTVWMQSFNLDKNEISLRLPFIANVAKKLLH